MARPKVLNIDWRNPDQRRAYNTAWRRRHGINPRVQLTPSERRARKRVRLEKWRAANRDHVRALNRASYHRNRAGRLARLAARDQQSTP